MRRIDIYCYVGCVCIVLISVSFCVSILVMPQQFKAGAYRRIMEMQAEMSQYLTEVETIRQSYDDAMKSNEKLRKLLQNRRYIRVPKKPWER